MLDLINTLVLHIKLFKRYEQKSSGQFDHSHLHTVHEHFSKLGESSSNNRLYKHLPESNVWFNQGNQPTEPFHFTYPVSCTVLKRNQIYQEPVLTAWQVFRFTLCRRRWKCFSLRLSSAETTEHTLHAHTNQEAILTKKKEMNVCIK